MNHQGLRRNVHCIMNVGLRKRLNLYKHGFKIYDLVLTEIQPFKSVKIYKEMYGHPDTVRHSVRMSYISLLILSFLNRYISVKTSLINNKVENIVNLGVLFLIMWINNC